MAADEEFLIDLNREKTIRQMSEEALEKAYDNKPNHPFVEDMEAEFELRGFLTERQRARLLEIAEE